MPRLPIPKNAQLDAILHATDWKLVQDYLGGDESLLAGAWTVSPGEILDYARRMGLPE